MKLTFNLMIIFYCLVAFTHQINTEFSELILNEIFNLKNSILEMKERIKIVEDKVQALESLLAVSTNKANLTSKRQLKQDELKLDLAPFGELVTNLQNKIISLEAKTVNLSLKQANDYNILTTTITNNFNSLNSSLNKLSLTQTNSHNSLNSALNKLSLTHTNSHNSLNSSLNKLSSSCLPRSELFSNVKNIVSGNITIDEKIFGGDNGHSYKYLNVFGKKQEFR